ncbi:MAG: class I SAM-dependent methyltransferase [Actinobacteria bacterium]|nr:class I SAM-dependent methyltransferase [Actinomycetota bacterium]
MKNHSTRPLPVKRVGTGEIALRALTSAAIGAVARREELRYHVVRDMWSILKRFGAGSIDTVEIRALPGVKDAVVEAFVDDRNRAVLAALCASLGCKTFFEIGTNRGRTAWSVARHNPQMKVHTLDLPSADSADDVALELLPSDRGFVANWGPGLAFQGTPEEPRIEQLFGDSATFDFSPFWGKIDLVFVDGSHSYSYVRNDTEAALRMLTPTGTIVWDDYPAFPGIYSYLTELSRSLDRRPFHILETRMVVYSRQDLVSRPLAEEYLA